MRRLLIAISLVGLATGAAADPLAASAGERAAVERMLAGATDAYRLDVGISNLAVAPDGRDIVVSAEVRVAVSDPAGHLMSVVRGSAKVCVPAASYRDAHLPRMRKDALLAASAAVTPKLRAMPPPRDRLVAR